ncbi:17192_t:CDS:1, partial [Gigaspora rosea]
SESSHINTPNSSQINLLQITALGSSIILSDTSSSTTTTAIKINYGPTILEQQNNQIEQIIKNHKFQERKSKSNPDTRNISNNYIAIDNNLRMNSNDIWEQIFINENDSAQRNNNPWNNRQYTTLHLPNNNNNYSSTAVSNSNQQPNQRERGYWNRLFGNNKNNNDTSQFYIHDRSNQAASERR